MSGRTRRLIIAKIILCDKWERTKKNIYKQDQLFAKKNEQTFNEYGRKVDRRKTKTKKILDWIKVFTFEENWLLIM